MKTQRWVCWSGTAELDEEGTRALNASIVTEYILQCTGYLCEDTDNLFFNTLLNTAYDDMNSVVVAKIINILKDLYAQTDSFAAMVTLDYTEQEGGAGARRKKRGTAGAVFPLSRFLCYNRHRRG